MDLQIDSLSSSHRLRPATRHPGTSRRSRFRARPCTGFHGNLGQAPASHTGAAACVGPLHQPGVPQFIPTPLPKIGNHVLSDP